MPVSFALEDLLSLPVLNHVLVNLSGHEGLSSDPLVQYVLLEVLFTLASLLPLPFPFLSTSVAPFGSNVPTLLLTQHQMLPTKHLTPPPWSPPGPPSLSTQHGEVWDVQAALCPVPLRTCHSNQYLQNPSRLLFFLFSSLFYFSHHP